MKMFERAEFTYNFDFESNKVEGFFKDKANPLGNIVDLIEDGSKVLDIGAGNGILGWLISHKKKNVIIDAVEPSAYALAQGGRDYYQNVYCGFYNDVRSEIAVSDYDYVVLADVIEHVPNPEVFLSEIVSDIRNNTKLIVSVPHIGHGSVRMELLNGSFKYVDSGLLERTHLRFFTLQTIEQLVLNVGMHLTKLSYLVRPISFARYRVVPSFRSRLRLLRDREANTYQYLVVMTRSDSDRVVHVCEEKPMQKDFLKRLLLWD